MLKASLPLKPLVVRHFSLTKWSQTQPRSSTDSRCVQAPSATASSISSDTDNTSNPSVQNTSTPDLPHTQKNNFDVAKWHLQKWTDHATLTFRNRADNFAATTAMKFSQLGSQLNKVTGYELIEDLKREVVKQEARINTTRQAARDAKTAHNEAVARRSLSQREVNDLLQRKSNWTDSDVVRFTSLVRQDHLFEQEEARAKAAVDETENAVEREFSQLMQSILARYHEEQVWSDKIRSASTYGSLAALGLNMLVFILAIVVVEPWKRRKLAQTFERKTEELSLRNEARLDANMKEIGEQLADQERLIVELGQGVSQGAMHMKEITREVEGLVEDGNTKRTSTMIELRRSGIELATVATGAFVAGILSCLWLGR